MDLQKSALEPKDMAIRPLTDVERSAIDIPSTIPGFVIPYFDIVGFPTPFYRCRLFDFSIKYKQPKGTNNRVYFPPKFQKTLNGHKYVIITEGEKKAACATKYGFPTVGLGGVYSWRNRTIQIPESAIVNQTKKGNVDLGVGRLGRLSIRMPESFDPDSMLSDYADGFSNLIELVKEQDLTVIIAFDSNRPSNGTSLDVQRAAARLGLELRYQGIQFDKIKQLILPFTGINHEGHFSDLTPYLDPSHKLYKLGSPTSSDDEDDQKHLIELEDLSTPLPNGAAASTSTLVSAHPVYSGKTENLPSVLPQDVKTHCAIHEEFDLPEVMQIRFDKVGMDDFLVMYGSRQLHYLLYGSKSKGDTDTDTDTAADGDNELLYGDSYREPKFRLHFPIYPNILAFVAKKLQSGKMNRKDVTLIALTILADLDARGMRLRAVDGSGMYYFNRTEKELMRATLIAQNRELIIDDKFGILLYRWYGLTSADNRILKVLATQFAAEDPVSEVKPKRNVFTRQDQVVVQLNSKEYAVVDSQGIVFNSNGVDGVLFDQASSEDVKSNQVKQALLKQNPGAQTQEVSMRGQSFGSATEVVLPHTRSKQANPHNIAKPSQGGNYRPQTVSCHDDQFHPIKPWWYDTLKQTRIVDHSDDNYMFKLITLLYYASPWLSRWRDTQLPIEIAIGEAGSGKSTLYALRLDILTGRSDLRNSPQSLKDWHASVTNVSGLHVTDNVDLNRDAKLKKSLSNEMCRIITEGNPTVEMRKYFTESDLARRAVDAVFAVTAVNMPFNAPDLMQRSFKIQLDKGTDGTSYDAHWAKRQISSRGGREGWIAHHLSVLNRFFQIVDREWDDNYKASFRLIHFEQILVTLAKVFGWDHNWIPGFLCTMTDATTVQADWVISGLAAYTEFFLSKVPPGVTQEIFTTANHIVDWASGREEYVDCVPLTSANKLGRYIDTHKALVAKTCGLVYKGMKSGKLYYSVLPPKARPIEGLDEGDLVDDQPNIGSGSGLDSSMSTGTSSAIDI